MGSDARTACPDASGQGTADDDSDASDYSSVSTIDDLPPIRAYGHTYHGSGTILTPNDESERARLEIQHSLFQLCLDGALTSARLPVPTGRPLSILDIGAGTGAWAIAMAAQHPTASIRGVDVSAALLPTAVPPNVVFEVSDANEPWAAQPLNLDFVHVRNLVGGGVRDFKALYAQAFQHLRPGGQIEVAEVRSRWFDFEDDGPGASQGAESELTMEGAVMPASREFEMGLAEYSQQLGIDFDPIPKVSGWLEDVGFEKVMEKNARSLLPHGDVPRTGSELLISHSGSQPPTPRRPLVTGSTNGQPWTALILTSPSAKSNQPLPHPPAWCAPSASSAGGHWLDVTPDRALRRWTLFSTPPSAVGPRTWL
ncbi:hypothetical protein VDGE_02765 [Verticillium dahliae]|uniref:Methyltransferase n=1 Tax=Verticillium dahliae TaxID=27337 RepID=A0A444RWD0_VERDA|nr:hypothetical protein VDGE_02765 [Verticillium dahliae]